MISLSSLNSVAAGQPWSRNRQVADTVATPKPDVNRKTYQENQTVSSNEEVLQGEVLPRARTSQQTSTQSFLLERTMARAKPLMAPDPSAHQSAKPINQMNTYQSMQGMNHSYSTSGNTGVDIYI